jgi:Ca-activated chloride channel family protein
VEKLRSDVTMKVDGQGGVVHVEVEELFRNPSGALAEGDYLYPVAAGAVFTDFSLFMGEQELRGEVLPADQARRIYEEIVRRKKDPALIELVGHGILRARVFPIEPGDTRRVILRYTQLLGRDGELLRLRYFRQVGACPATQAQEVHEIRPWPRPEERFTLTIRLEGASRFATPYSPTHPIEVREHGEDELEIVHRGEGNARDFELLLPLRQVRPGAHLLAHAPAGEEGYFMLLISPPEFGGQRSVPRDLTLVLDVSGSMSGGKLEQARQALEQILAGLRAQDRFRLITFSSAVRLLRRDFTYADQRSLEEAQTFLSAARAEGSTNVMDALREALVPRTQRDRLSLIVFLTDGKPTLGETGPERIAQAAEQLRDGERVFAFGVGHDVNTYLLDRLAEGGRGAVSYVRPGDDVEEAVSSLTRKIGTPALSDLAIARSPVELSDHYPTPLPDLFYGEDLLLFGRYRGSGRGELVLEGSRAGRSVRFRYPVELPRNESDNPFIPRLWAARKAGALTVQVRLHGPDEELIEEIRQLGLRYGIITEYTSYLVEEPMLAANDPRVALDRARGMAAAPGEQWGAVAFSQAETSSRLRAVEKLADADRWVAGTVAEGSPARAGTVRHVGRRLFVLRDGCWTDRTYDGDLERIRVAPFSEAYFELVRRLPALKTYFALGERLLLAGRSVAIELTAEGLSSWPAEGLRRVLEDLAGSV